MREGTIINGFQNLEQRFQQVVQMFNNLQQSVRLAFTGFEIRGSAIQSLLQSKKALTEAEAHALISKLTAFLATKVQMTEDEVKALEADLKSVVFQGPFISEADLTAQVGLTIQQMQKQAEDEAKKQNIVIPTADQVAKVNATPAETATVPVAPTTPEVPQA